MAGPAATITAVVEVLVQTFGPFVIPAAVFAIGLLGYGVLFSLNRWFERR